MDHNVIAAIVFFAISIVCTVVATFCSIYGHDGAVNGMCASASTVCYVAGMFCLVFTFEADTNLMIALAFAGIAVMKVNGYFAKKSFTKNDSDYVDTIQGDLHENLFWLRSRRKKIEALLSSVDDKNSPVTETNTNS